MCSAVSRRSPCSSSEWVGGYLFLLEDEAGRIVAVVHVDDGDDFLEGGGGGAEFGAESKSHLPAVVAVSVLEGQQFKKVVDAPSRRTQRTLYLLTHSII